MEAFPKIVQGRPGLELGLHWILGAASENSPGLAI
jgi:hypothetical protein